MTLIDRDELIMYVADCRVSESITWQEKELIMDFLQNAPIIESRPKGKWLTEVYEYGKDGEEDKWVVRTAEDGDSAYCSLCYNSALLDGGEDYALSPYCPHCGADMRGAE